METQRLPEGVELSYTDRAVHLTTNGALMTYLRQRGNGSLAAAQPHDSGWLRGGARRAAAHYGALHGHGAADPRVSGRHF